MWKEQQKPERVHRKAAIQTLHSTNQVKCSRSVSINLSLHQLISGRSGWLRAGTFRFISIQFGASSCSLIQLWLSSDCERAARVLGQTGDLSRVGLCSGGPTPAASSGPLTENGPKSNLQVFNSPTTIQVKAGFITFAVSASAICQLIAGSQRSQSRYKSSTFPALFRKSSVFMGPVREQPAGRQLPRTCPPRPAVPRLPTNCGGQPDNSAGNGGADLC